MTTTRLFTGDASLSLCCCLCVRGSEWRESCPGPSGSRSFCFFYFAIKKREFELDFCFAKKKERYGGHTPPHTRTNTSAFPYTHVMAPPTTRSRSTWAVDRVTSLPEFWANVAKHGDGLVSAWKMMRVCRSSRLGIREWLATLPGVVVCGGMDWRGITSDVWRLDLATLHAVGAHAQPSSPAT